MTPQTSTVPHREGDESITVPDAVVVVTERIKRIAFGFRNFANYRIRALLYAGKPNWNLLTTITPH